MNTKKTAILAAAFLVAAGSVTAQAAPNGRAPTSTPALQGAAAYQIVNAKTGKCATIAGGILPDNNLQLVQFTCDTDASRRWTLGNWDGSSYQIVNAKTGKCATIAGGTLPDNNLPLVQFTCDTDASRRWRLGNWDGSSYQIVNAKTGKCATIAGGTLPDNN
ncbi:RICIN domain-containing protein, partial [Streptomyces sp. NPDC055722]